MIKQEYLEKLLAARQEVVNAIDGLTEEQVCRPMAEGKWSIKDTIGHLAAWEGEVAQAFEQKARGERPTVGDITDYEAWNQVEAKKRNGLSLDEIRTEFAGNRKRLLAMIDGLPDDGDVWSASRSTAKLLDVIIEHDQHHCKSIRDYRAQ